MRDYEKAIEALQTAITYFQDYPAFAGIHEELESIMKKAKNIERNFEV